jgi:hypothetical protein
MFLELHMLYWKLGILNFSVEAALIYSLKSYKSSKLLDVIV